MPAASEPSRQIHLGVLSQSQAKGTLRHIFRCLCCVGSARDLLSAMYSCCSSTSKKTAYDNWLAMGSCEDLSPEDIAMLRETSRPGLFVHREIPKDHGLDLEVTLEPFEVRLVTLQPQGLL